MPGFIVTTSSSAICQHGAQVAIISSNTRVMIAGSPAAVLNDQFTVAGCPFQVPVGAGTKPQPCVKIQWVAPATRVRVGGQPVILQTSSGICLSAEQIPQGAPTVAQAQPRVRGT
ncbi:MAG: hypothetical protein RLZZ387_3943 [Chloroflexota bacterium]|jgi:uncharacterized Zn-binding protein involved in type VI secretion